MQDSRELREYAWRDVFFGFIFYSTGLLIATLGTYGEKINSTVTWIFLPWGGCAICLAMYRYHQIRVLDFVVNTKTLSVRAKARLNKGVALVSHSCVHFAAAISVIAFSHVFMASRKYVDNRQVDLKTWELWTLLCASPSLLFSGVTYYCGHRLLYPRVVKNSGRTIDITPDHAAVLTTEGR
jgi:hypothetical protein